MGRKSAAVREASKGQETLEKVFQEGATRTPRKLVVGVYASYRVDKDFLGAVLNDLHASGARVALRNAGAFQVGDTEDFDLALVLDDPSRLIFKRYEVRRPIVPTFGVLEGDPVRVLLGEIPTAETGTEVALGDGALVDWYLSDASEAA